MKKDFEKKNIFGVQSNTPGQNLMRAITGSENSLGIPPYNYGLMMNILNSALSVDEVELCKRGFGFDREPQLQKEIAADLGVAVQDISDRAHIIVKKLQRSPYKAQLKALAPSLDDIFALIANLRAENGKLQESSTSNEAVAGLKRQCKKTKMSLERLKKANASLSYELDKANDKITTLESQFAEYQKQTIREKAHADAVKTVFEETIKVLSETVEEANVKFIAAVANAEIKVKTLEDLGLSKGIMNCLERGGIYDLETLCNTDERSLSSLRVCKDYRETIKKKLAEHGLSLRNAS